MRFFYQGGQLISNFESYEDEEEDDEARDHKLWANKHVGERKGLPASSARL
jgi:hypothetical protein